MTIRPAQPTDYPTLTELWEASVRATHDFLSAADIEALRPRLLADYLPAVILRVACDPQTQRIQGFVGVLGGKVEMLFIDPALRGRGIGRALLAQAITELAATQVDVNEQNPQALGFYQRLGFEVFDRSALDGQGRPFPLLHLRLAASSSEDPLAEILRYLPIDARLASAGQPSEAQLAAIAGQGFELVLNLALHDDPRYSLADEAASVAALGMAYVHIPVRFAEPTLDALDRFCRTLDEAGPRKKVFIHCAHNKRVPVFLALYRILRRGWPRETALAAMRQVWEPDATWQRFIAAALQAPPALR